MYILFVSVFAYVSSNQYIEFTNIIVLSLPSYVKHVYTCIEKKLMKLYASIGTASVILSCEQHHRRQTNEAVSFDGRTLIGGGASSIRKIRCREFLFRLCQLLLLHSQFLFMSAPPSYRLC